MLQLGWLCLWGTRVTSLKPQQTKEMRTHLGLDQKSANVLRLPQGIEKVGEEWFAFASVKKVIVPSSVEMLGKRAFFNCDQLREAIFEPDSNLKYIGDSCFMNCGF